MTRSFIRIKRYQGSANIRLVNADITESAGWGRKGVHRRKLIAAFSKHGIKIIIKNLTRD